MIIITIKDIVLLICVGICLIGVVLIWWAHRQEQKAKAKRELEDKYTQYRKRNRK